METRDGILLLDRSFTMIVGLPYFIEMETVTKKISITILIYYLFTHLPQQSIPI